MKKLFIYPAKLQRSGTLLLLLFSLFAKADYWTQKTDFGGLERFLPISFQINNKGYIGCGYDSVYQALEDFWEYDPVTNTWTQKADFGGGKRSIATGFSIGNKGYAGLGCDSAGDIHGDFWEYDPSLNTWSPIATFGGYKRFNALGFSIGNKGYVGSGLGQTSPYNDLWEYDPSVNGWSQVLISSFVTVGRCAFIIGAKAYIGLGIDSTGNTLSSFFEFDQQSATWTQIASFPPGYRGGVASFSVNNKGYMGTGSSQQNVLNDFWEYDPVLNQWTQKSSFPGFPRNCTASFSLNNKGYVGVGKNLTNLGLVDTYVDFWEYTPDSTTSIEEVATTNLEFTISPNPAKDYIVINIPGFENLEYLTVTDVAGKKVYETQVATPTLTFKLQTSNFPAGIYFIELNNGKQKAVKKFVKE